MPDHPLNPADLWPSTPEDDHRSRDALDRLLLGFQIIGFDWRYLYVNPAAARHGRKQNPRELVGRTMMEAYPGLENTRLFRELERCMRERCVAAFENEFTFADGTTQWFELRVQPVPEGICVYSIDIRDRKEAALALARRMTRHQSGSMMGRFLQSLFGR
jgi:PAS domain S-box-containing protein